MTIFGTRPVGRKLDQLVRKGWCAPIFKQPTWNLTMTRMMAMMRIMIILRNDDVRQSSNNQIAPRPFWPTPKISWRTFSFEYYDETIFFRRKLEIIEGKKTLQFASFLRSLVSWCIRQQKLLKRAILRIFALLPNISFVSLFYQFAQFCTGALWWDPTATNMHTGHFSILMQLQEKTDINNIWSSDL